MLNVITGFLMCLTALGIGNILSRDIGSMFLCVIDHALITWISCTDHVADHTLLGNSETQALSCSSSHPITLAPTVKKGNSS